MAASYKNQKLRSSLGVNGTLILICFIWILPTLGVFITSLRNSQDIFSSGWWTVLPHKENIQTQEIILDASVNIDEPMQIEGITATFEELRQSVTLPDGRMLTWYGNKRTRTIIVTEEHWVGFFSKPLTLDNYIDVLTGKEIRFTDAGGNEIIRKGNSLGSAFLNSIAVAVPATIIPILIAAFAAFGFSWLSFPGRGLIFTMVADRRICRIRVFLAEFPRARIDLHNGCRDSGCAFANFVGANFTGLHQIKFERDFPGNLAGSYRLRLAACHIFTLQLYEHPAA